MIGFLTFVTAIGALFGGAMFILGAVAAKSAPQEAAAAAMGMAAALIPYVLLRCAQLSAKRETDAQLLALLNVMWKDQLKATSSTAPER